MPTQSYLQSLVLNKVDTKETFEAMQEKGLVNEGELYLIEEGFTVESIGAAPLIHKHTVSDITDFPSSLPASDVYEWAKAPTKPTYTASEVGAPTTKEMEDAIAAIPTPDVSGQIGVHNTNPEAHKDIRDLIAGIPTPDVSGQIDSHNTDPSAHEDIRGLIDTKISQISMPDVPGQINSHNTSELAHDDIRKLVAAKADSSSLKKVATSGSYKDLADKPTKVSTFTNDAGYITGYTETDPTVPAWAKASTKPSYTAEEVGALPNTTSIPKKVSELQNDAGYITKYTETDPTVPAWAKASTKPVYTASEVGARPSTWVPTAGDLNLAQVATSGSYKDLSNTPTKVSAFTNDAGYITGYTETDPTVPAWAKASSKPTYTASEVGALASGGTAVAASKLATSQTINGMSFDGSAAINNYGVCSVAATNAAKTVDVGSTFSLVPGAQVIVKFTNANNAVSPTLNVNGTGAKRIYQYGTTVVGDGTTTTGWSAGAVQTFTYDGTGWIRDYWYNTTSIAASSVTGGTLKGKVNANATAAATLSDAMLRDATIQTTDLVTGADALGTGSICLVYE